MASWKSIISTDSFPFLAAINAASLQTFAMSAPANPGVCSASLCKSSASEILIGSRCTLKISSLPFTSGLSIEI